MAADHFCLRWNNYQSNMVTELDTLRSEEHLVDVTLSCEGQKFRAHKVILSACSAYFRNVFKENPCDHPVVILKDVSHEDVEALLSFVYQGVVYVSEKKLASFLQTAELLQIKGLTGAASSIKENHAGSDKGGPPPLAPSSWPSRSSKSSSSPTPPKRKKGTPVRIYKQNDSGDPGSDTNSNNGGDDENMDDNKQQLAVTVKQECIDDCNDSMNNVQVSLGIDEEGDSVTYQGSPGGAGGGSVSGNEFRDDGGDSNSGGSAAVFADIGDDDGEVKRGDDEATLLERSLSGAGVSRPFDLQGPFSSFPIPAPGQGLPEQLTPADGRAVRGEWRCMQPQRCRLCGKIFSNSGNLRQHVSNVHTPGQHVPCNFCSRVFKNKEYLRKHHVQTHNVPLRRHRSSTLNNNSSSSGNSINNTSAVAGPNNSISSNSNSNIISGASTVNNAYSLFNLVKQSLQVKNRIQ